MQLPVPWVEGQGRDHIQLAPLAGWPLDSQEGAGEEPGLRSRPTGSDPSLVKCPHEQLWAWYRLTVTYLALTPALKIRNRILTPS